jgi:hypothetical protein
MVFALDAPAAKPKPILPVRSLTARAASRSSPHVCGGEVVPAGGADPLRSHEVVEAQAGLAQVPDPDEGEVDHVRADPDRGFADELVARVLESDALERDLDAGVLRLERVQSGAHLVDVLDVVTEDQLDLCQSRRGQPHRDQAGTPGERPLTEPHRPLLPPLPVDTRADRDPRRNAGAQLWRQGGSILCCGRFSPLHHCRPDPL